MSRLITSATIGNFLAAPSANLAKEAIQANPITVTAGGSTVTAEVGNYYIANSGGTPITFNDPAVGVMGQGYFVLVNTIAALVGGQSFSPGNLIYRIFNGSAWVSHVYAATNAANVTAFQTFIQSPTSANLALLLTDESGTGGGFVRATGATLTSPSLVGPVNLTGQDASTADRVMTRGLADARYGELIVSRLATNSAPIQSQTVLQPTGCSVALPVGVWMIQAQTNAENADATAQFRFACSVTGGTFSTDRGRVLWGLGNTGAIGHDNSTFLTAARTLGNGTRGYISYDGIITVTAGTTTIATQFAQNVSVAANTFVAANSYIMAQRIG